MRRLLALTVLLAALVLPGCAPSLRMQAVDSIGRRTLRIEDVAVELKKALKVQPSTDATPDTVAALPPAVIIKALDVILYEAQEITGYVKPLRKDVGEVPQKKQIELDTQKDRDTQFEYVVKAGAKASKRARWKKKWHGVLSLPQRIIEWTIKAIWNILPWWIRLPALGVFAAWLFTTLYVYYAKARAARAAVQAEATVARLQRHVDDKAFAAAVDPERNPDFARVHERQKRIAGKRARKNQEKDRGRKR